jgi:hypothetical protein
MSEDQNNDFKEQIEREAKLLAQQEEAAAAAAAKKVEVETVVVEEAPQLSQPTSLGKAE